ncbi:hypothetical protein K2173_017922 [Erythroxylum novogranatense]|uniref:Uncharacterized protein n=1 Tax=Erythroxylum novogranatense TaxID=1862640 RepID=A0AAV8TLF5_9ROSI|nr:hypothetical protein K2173_017922 [Erythroxylum novogranatense]
MDSRCISNGSHRCETFSCPEVENCEVKGRKLLKHFLFAIGVHEFFWIETWRSAITELVSTACLLFSLTISVTGCMELHIGEPKLLLPILVFGIVFLFVLVTIPLTGAHMNPTFSLMAALKGIVTPVRALVYVVAQCLGSLMAAIVVKSMMQSSTVERHSLNGCLVDRNGEGVNTGIALGIEFSSTFFVLFLILTVAYDQKRFKELGLPMMCVLMSGVFALVVFMSSAVTLGRAGYGGAGLNPARCLGPALVLGGSLWDGHWVFWVGPFLACMVFYCFTMTLPRGVMKADEEQGIQESGLVSGLSLPIT